MLIEVTRKSQIIKNLLTFFSYSQSARAEERAYYANRLRAGVQYVAAKSGTGDLIFCPSRVAGYANITMRRHLAAGDERDGTITTPAICDALGAEPVPDKNLEAHLAAKCIDAGVRLYDKKHSFWLITETLTLPPHTLNNEFSNFENEVERSFKESSRTRRKRLAKAPRIPGRRRVTISVFVRNPDVVAEVLHRSGGYCEVCSQPAPFKRSSDGSPFLEVHHIKTLANGGEDTVENARACCPNCHRRAHHG